MNREELKLDVFKDLINKQLEPFGQTYESVKDDKDWFLKYPVTQEQEDEFIQWGIAHIQKKLKSTKAMAEKEMNWFILSYGLTRKTIKPQDNIIEWAILIGLFKATCEQQAMLIGVPKREAKLIFNRWMKEGDKLLKIIERESNLQKLEAVTEFIENAAHEIRKANEVSKL